MCVMKSPWSINLRSSAGPGFLWVLVLIGLSAWRPTAGGVSQSPAAPAESAPAAVATALPTEQAVREYMEAGDRYLHHSRLKPGMIGYGLTVLQGQEPVRFEVQIVSVMLNWGPRQDVILARLRGQGLEQTGPIEGMSGSPIYVRDERDGKDKLIGALAYGWPLQKDCLVGIQPISQMLTIQGFVGLGRPLQSAPQGSRLPPEAMAKLLEGRKTDFLNLLRPPGLGTSPTNPTQLAPLATPLMTGGLSAVARDRLAERLEHTGLVLVQGGSGGVPRTLAGEAAPLQPGGPLAVPLVEGDLDFSAMGTVTDVVDNRVLGFGHAFAAEGNVCLPMGPGYVHTVVSSLMSSFKLGTPLPCVGALVRDDQTGVAGIVGQSAQMIPMSVEVVREDGRPQAYRFRLAQHRWLTPLLGETVASYAATAMSELPEDHTVRYRLSVDFEGLPSVNADNISSQSDVYPMLSDLTRPLVAMMNSPLGPPAKVRGITLRMEVSDRACAAKILDLTLDGRIYQPGQTVTGRLRVQPYRQAVAAIPVSLKLPEDLSDGAYTLTAADAPSALELDRRRMPQRFDPRTNDQLLAAVQDVLGRREDSLYLHLPLDRRGVAIGQGEMSNLPPSRRAMLMQQPRFDVKEFEAALVVAQPTPYVLSGHAAATFEVLRKTREIPVQGR